MFTALQFSQLVAAAWSGPAVCHHATVCHYQAPGGYASTEYSVAYHVGPACYYAHALCPFEALAGAVAKAAAAGVAVSRYRAQRVIARTAAAFCGIRPQPGFAARARRHRCAPLQHV